MSQLTELAKPFAARLVKAAPQGKYGSYVPHDIVTQKLLLIVGPFSQEVSRVVRGLAPEIVSKNNTFAAVEDAVVGCVLRCTFNIDGQEVVVEEVGDCESPAMKDTDGDRLKDAVSDAVKRCAMRVGCGLHLWSGDDYILHGQLEQRENPAETKPDTAKIEGPQVTNW